MNFGEIKTFDLQHRTSPALCPPPHLTPLPQGCHTGCAGLVLHLGIQRMSTQLSMCSGTGCTHFGERVHKGTGWVSQTLTCLTSCPNVTWAFSQSHHEAFVYAIALSSQLIVHISIRCPFQQESLTSMSWTVLSVVSRLSLNHKPPDHIPRFTIV